MPVCPSCGVGYMEGESHLCGQEQRWRQSGTKDDSKNRTAITPRDAAGGLSGRYRDGYREGRFIAGFGQVVKGAGAVLGILLAIGGVVGSKDVGSYGSSVVVASIVIGGVVALWFFIVGVIIGAQGQQLIAALDTAVNSSPFLTNDERARIMF